MGNLAQQVFTNNGSWTAPAGVTQVTIYSQAPYVGPNPNFQMVFNNILSLSSSGALYGWGENTNGSLGLGDITPRSSPVQVVGGLNFTQIANGRNNMLAISKAGQLYSWGDNTYGQLGQGSAGGTGMVSSPVQVLGGLTWAQILSAPYDFQNFSIGLTTTGKAYGWGFNGPGNLGIGNNVDQSSPVAVVGGLTFNKLVMDGGNASCFGFANDGNLYSWGIGGVGLGNGNSTQKSSPNLVVGGLSFTQLSSTNANVIALTADGTPWAWGSNTNGNLGLGDRTNRSSPVQVLGGLKFKYVQTALGNGKCTYGLTAAGQLYAWGDNTTGNLGLGDVVPRSSPVAVVGGLTFQSFVANGEMVLALATNGQLYGWGNNTQGQLGNNTRTAVSSPVAVVGGILFADCPNTHYSVDNVQAAFAYTSSGRVYSWGQNVSSGVLGLGDTANRSSPVVVLGNFAPKTAFPVNSITVPVVPGTTYTLTMKQPNPSFGATQIANFSPTSVTISFEQ